MREETKAALKEMIEAIKVSNALCNMVELSPNTPIHYYNNKELEALADAFEKEKQTK